MPVGAAQANSLARDQSLAVHRPIPGCARPRSLGRATLLMPEYTPAPDYAQEPEFTAEPATHMAGPVDWAAGEQPASLHPRSAMEVLNGLSDKVSQGAVAEYQPIPLGLSPLDRTLGGGLRSGELMMIGGAQGTGKTTMALQIARNIAQSGQANVLYICFEHDEEYLLNRLMAMESALAGSMPPDSNRSIKIQDVRREVLGTWLAQGGHGQARSARQPAAAPGARAHRPLRPGPIPVARLARPHHGAQPAHDDRGLSPRGAEPAARGLH